MLWTRELCSELERQQNEEKNNPNVRIEPRTFCYPGRCPKSVRLEGTSYLRLRLMITLDHKNYQQHSEPIRELKKEVYRNVE